MSVPLTRSADKNWITARWACLEESMARSLTVISLRSSVFLLHIIVWHWLPSFGSINVLLQKCCTAKFPLYVVRWYSAHGTSSHFKESVLGTCICGSQFYHWLGKRVSWLKSFLIFLFYLLMTSKILCLNKPLLPPSKSLSACHTKHHDWVTGSVCGHSKWLSSLILFCRKLQKTTGDDSHLLCPHTLPVLPYRETFSSTSS